MLGGRGAGGAPGTQHPPPPSWEVTIIGQGRIFTNQGKTSQLSSMRQIWSFALSQYGRRGTSWSEATTGCGTWSPCSALSVWSVPHPSTAPKPSAASVLPPRTVLGGSGSPHLSAGFPGAPVKGCMLLHHRITSCTPLSLNGLAACPGATLASATCSHRVSPCKGSGIILPHPPGL